MDPRRLRAACLAALVAALAAGCLGGGRSGDGADAPAARCGGPLPAPPPGRPRLRLDVAVAAGGAHVAGRLRLDWRAPRRLDRLVFRLFANTPTLRRAGARLAVGSVRVGGRAVAGSLPDPTTLVVPLRPAVAAGEPVTATVRFRLRVPPAAGNPNLRLARRGEDVRLASFFPLLAWDGRRGWVVEPGGSGFAEAWTSPVADWDVRVAAPRGLTVLATGEALGGGRFRARAVRDVAVAVGRYRLASTTARAPAPVRVHVAVERGAGPAPADWADKLATGLRTLAARYGAYPWPTLTAVVTADITGGIEYPQLVFLGAGRRDLIRAATHEVAHQWFYSLVGNDQWRDPWLDESLATWASADADGFRDVILAVDVPPAVRGRLGESMAFWDRHARDYFAGAYAQGVKALADLGDPSAVNCALRRYVAANAYRAAAPADLVRELERELPGARSRLREAGVR